MALVGEDEAKKDSILHHQSVSLSSLMLDREKCEARQRKWAKKWGKAEDTLEVQWGKSTFNDRVEDVEWEDTGTNKDKK